MQWVFVQIKCELGHTYEVAAKLGDKADPPELHSTSGAYDLMAKFRIPDGEDIGRFIAREVHSVPHIRDTFTIMAFKAF